MSGVRRLSLAIAAAGVLTTSQAPANEPSHALMLDYRDLQEWAFTSEASELGPEGLHWQVDIGDWHLDRGRLWLQRPTPSGRLTGFVFEGTGRFGVDGELVEATRLLVFGDGDQIGVQSEAGVRFMLIAGAPFREPIAPYGPFVMNTFEEIQQALIELQQGTFIKP